MRLRHKRNCTMCHLEQNKRNGTTFIYLTQLKQICLTGVSTTTHLIVDVLEKFICFLINFWVHIMLCLDYYMIHRGQTPDSK